MQRTVLGSTRGWRLSWINVSRWCTNDGAASRAASCSWRRHLSIGPRMGRCNACLSFGHRATRYQPEKNHFQQDIVTMPATVDVLFHFLRLTDAQTGKPTTLQFKQGSDCLIAKIFASFVRSEIGATSLSSRLECLPQDTRREVLRAFVQRFQDAFVKSRDEPNQRISANLSSA